MKKADKRTTNYKHGYLNGYDRGYESCKNEILAKMSSPFKAYTETDSFRYYSKTVDNVPYGEEVHMVSSPAIILVNDNLIFRFPAGEHRNPSIKETTKETLNTIEDEVLQGYLKEAI